MFPLGQGLIRSARPGSSFKKTKIANSKPSAALKGACGRGGRECPSTSACHPLPGTSAWAPGTGSWLYCRRTRRTGPRRCCTTPSRHWRPGGRRRWCCQGWCCQEAIRKWAMFSPNRAFSKSKLCLVWGLFVFSFVRSFFENTFLYGAAYVIVLWEWNDNENRLS